MWGEESHSRTSDYRQPTLYLNERVLHLGTELCTRRLERDSQAHDASFKVETPKPSSKLDSNSCGISQALHQHQHRRTLTELKFLHHEQFHTMTSLLAQTKVPNEDKLYRRWTGGSFPPMFKK